MTNKNEINQLKLLAKRFAHAMRSNHIEALDVIAAKLSFPHWKALAVKANQGWTPSEDELEKVEAFVREYFPSIGGRPQFIEQSMSRPAEEPIKVGEIDGHAYQVFEVSGDIRMEGEGWRILIGEADFSQPVVEIETTHKEINPANDRDFVDKALEVVETQALKARAGIASDWPRRSTKPNAKGEVVHPIYGDSAAEWFCLHCDGRMTGAQIAQNLWHCPRCNASPLDIFTSPWWLEGSDEKPTAIECAKDRKRPEPTAELVDSRPTLRLDDQSISLLLCVALLEDANTPGERLGALLAEFSAIAEGASPSRPLRQELVWLHQLIAVDHDGDLDAEETARFAMIDLLDPRVEEIRLEADQLFDFLVAIIELDPRCNVNLITCHSAPTSGERVSRGLMRIGGLFETPGLSCPMLISSSDKT